MSASAAIAAQQSQPGATDAPRARGLLLRKCECGEKAGASGECEDCKKKKLLQRRASGPAAPGTVPAAVHDVLRSSGRPLDAGTRSFMEPRFGQDFSNVRIHDDARAAESAQAVRAHAWTVGDHVAFAPGKYDPHSTAGRQLLAHELAHTVQQSGLQRAGSGVEMPGGHEDSRLEADADAVASRVMSGFTGSTRAAAPGRPVLSRAPAPVTAVTVPLTVTWQGVTQTFKVTSETNWQTPAAGATAAGPLEASYTVDTALVPQSKGAAGVAKYQEAATGGALQCVLTMTGTGSVAETAAWQERDDTDTMRRTWLGATGVPTANADAAWSAAWQASGGAATFAATFPRTPSGTCQMDHIIELQFGGGNNAGNLMPLDGSPNRHSGGFLRGEAWGLASAIYADATLAPVKPKQIRLRFLSAQPSPYANAIPAPDCLTCAAAMRAAAGAAASAPGAPAPVTTPFNLTARAAGATAGGVSTTLQLPNGSATGAAINIYEDPAHRASGLLISGLVLKTLKKGTGKTKDLVNAEPDTEPGRKTRLPISMTGAPPKIPLDVDPQPSGVMRQKTTTTNIPYTFPFLSPGIIRKLAVSPDGKLTFSGTLNPTVPFLPKEVKVAYENDIFKITSSLNTKTMRPPLPGFKLIEPLEMAVQLAPEFSASGKLNFALGGSKPIATGSITVGADATGITATGTLVAHIPGVDQASGTITYANGAWTGQIVVESSQIKLPYVQSARLVLDIDNTGLKPSGEVALLFPRELGSAKLGFSRAGSQFVYTGKGRFKVPGLKEVDVSVWYNGTSLTATANNIGFTWKGLNGTMNVTYQASSGKEGTVTGNGKITFTKGDFTGEMDAKLGNTGRLSGRGSVKYPFNFRGTRLDATATLIINEDQSVRVEGAVKLPQPVQLFRKFGDKRSIFHIQKNIPIPGASIGPVGLVAVIEGGVAVDYGIGPGELRNVVLTTAFNPLAANPDPEVAFHCDLQIPAQAGISGTLGGGLGVDVGIASVTGTVTVTASLDLNSTAGGPLDARYSNKRFELKAKPRINAALSLGLSLDARARAEAGVGPFSVSTEKTWNLGSRKINLSQFSMAVPISYASDQDFTAPSMSDIEWGPPPAIDFSDIMKQLFNGASPSESSS